MYEFLLEEMAPKEMLAGLMAAHHETGYRWIFLAPLFCRR